MKLLNYLALNIRHYFGKARQLLDALRIRLFARQDYERMRVPAWDSVGVAALSRPASSLSQLLALNETAQADAERILQGEFSLFGKVFNGAPEAIQWNKDYFSGRTYEPAVYSSYSIDENTGSDIIVPWELSRLQFVPTLIQAYRVSGEEKYAQHFIKQLDSWEKSNPYLFGINWICGLDIAIRALNIALGLIYFKDIESASRARATRLLWAHLAFLQERDLYLPKRTVNNHQLIAALLHYGLLHLFDQTNTREWRQAAYGILAREIERQFNPDGGNFESALLYHQFSLEAAFATVALLGGNDMGATLADETRVPAILAERLKAATRFTASYTRTWSGVPQIGDSSDGRIIVHRNYFSWTPEDNTYLAEWSRLAFPGEDPFADRPALPNVQLFADTGLGIYQTERYGALFTAMPVVANAAGHNHLDKAGMILQIGGIPVLVDAGTYCYTSDTASRYRHRQGRAHNVLLLGNQDQAELQKSAAFATPHYGEIGIGMVQTPLGTPVFQMWHDGYCRLAHRGRVSRQVSCDAEGLLLKDSVAGSGEEQVALIFNLHPEISTEIREDHLLLSRGNSPLCTIHPAPGWAGAIETSTYSNRYAARQDSRRIVISRTVSLPAEVHTHITLLMNR